MNDIVKFCKKHGELIKKQVSVNNKCLECAREYSREYRKKNPEKIKENNDRYNALIKEFKEHGFEYKPTRRNKRYKELRTHLTCKKHGELDNSQMILMENGYLRCRLCAYERNRSWEQRNPEKVKAQKRRTYLAHASRYTEEAKLRQKGITKEEFEFLIFKQDNKCAICLDEETIVARQDGTRSPLSIDHCHKTGFIRGLLCGRCNRGLGLFNDSIDLLNKAIKYLGEAHDIAVEQSGSPAVKSRNN